MKGCSGKVCGIPSAGNIVLILNKERILTVMNLQNVLENIQGIQSYGDVFLPSETYRNNILIVKIRISNNNLLKCSSKSKL